MTIDRLSEHTVLVTHYFPNHRGGIELVAGMLAKGLAEDHGKVIEWFASDCDPPPTDAISGCLRFRPQRTWNGAEQLLGLPWPVWSWPALKRLARAARNASAIHVHDFIYLGSLVAVIFALRYGKPVLVTQHIGHVPYKNPLLRMALSLINRTIGAYVLKRATQVVFISTAVEQYFSGFVRWKTQPMFIPNGTDHGIFHPLASAQRLALRKQRGYSSETPLFLFVGRFTEKKGLPLIRQLARALPHVQWHLAGHGAERPEDWGEPNVHVHRGLTGSTLAPLYQIADLLVLPSRGEGFPLVVQEAMACGTPALVSSETAEGAPMAAPFLFHEDCSTGKATAAWINRLRRLAAEPSALDQLRPRVAAFAVAQWGLNNCVEQYGKVLETFLRPHQRRNLPCP